MTLKINRTKVMRPDDPDAVWTQIPEHGEDV